MSRFLFRLSVIVAVILVAASVVLLAVVASKFVDIPPPSLVDLSPWQIVVQHLNSGKRTNHYV